MNRHLSRIIVMQSLYEWDFRNGESAIDIAKRNIERIGDDGDGNFILEVVGGVVDHLNEIDEMITKAAPEWPIEQISVVDKTILRLSIFELLFAEEVPPKVAINEAVELGKTFGGENSSKFINGVLGTLYRKSDRYNPEEEVEITENENKEDVQEAEKVVDQSSKED